MEKQRLGAAEFWVWLFWKIQGAFRLCHPFAMRADATCGCNNEARDGPFTPLEHGHEAQDEAMSVHNAAAYPTVDLLLLCYRWGLSRVREAPAPEGELLFNRSKRRSLAVCGVQTNGALAGSQDISHHRSAAQAQGKFGATSSYGGLGSDVGPERLDLAQPP